MAYQKNFTTTYTINGHEYTVTALALFDSNTNELIPDKKLDDQAAEIARQQYRDEMGLLSPQGLKQLFLVLAEELITNRDGGMIKARITKETNLFIKPQNVEDNERRCSSCKSRKFASKYQ